MTPYPDIPTATAAIQAHPACQSFSARPNAYVVFYPPAYVIPGGTMVQRTGDDLASLNLLYTNLDNWWQSQTLQIPS